MYYSLLPAKAVVFDHPYFLYRSEPAGSIDVLLPAIHHSKLKFLRDFEPIANHFVRNLLSRHRNRLLRAAYDYPEIELSLPESLRIRYQPQGLKLRRVSLRIEQEVRTELKILSTATRCSMSLILVLMIQWEYVRHLKFLLRGWDPSAERSVGTPTSSSVTMSYAEDRRIYTLQANFSRSDPVERIEWHTGRIILYSKKKE